MLLKFDKPLYMPNTSHFWLLSKSGINYLRHTVTETTALWWYVGKSALTAVICQTQGREDRSKIWLLSKLNTSMLGAGLNVWDGYWSMLGPNMKMSESRETRGLKKNWVSCTVGGTSSGSRNVKWLTLYICCLWTEMAEIWCPGTFFEDVWTYKISALYLLYFQSYETFSDVLSDFH